MTCVTGDYPLNWVKSTSATERKALKVAYDAKQADKLKMKKTTGTHSCVVADASLSAPLTAPLTTPLTSPLTDAAPAAATSVPTAVVITKKRPGTVAAKAKATKSPTSPNTLPFAPPDAAAAFHALNAKNAAAAFLALNAKNNVARTRGRGKKAN